MKLTKYAVNVRLIEPMLGTAPSDAQIYTKFIASKKAEEDAVTKTLSAEKKAETTADLSEEEIKLLPEQTDENRGVTVFRRNSSGIVLLDYMLRGFLKEGARAMENGKKSDDAIAAVKSKIDRFVHVVERQVPVTRNGQPITEPDGILERPLRAETAQGPRVALAASEYINASTDTPVELSFHLYILPHKNNEIGIETINEWLEYGLLNGLGQWRSGGYGKFAGKAFAEGSVVVTINDDLTVSVVAA